MGVLDFFKNWRKDKENATYAKMLNNDFPVFSQFGNDVYASDVVQQAIYTIVTEMKKLQPKHVRRDGFDMRPVYDDVERVLYDPNYLMTKSDFIEKITWQVMLNYNAFIYIERDKETGRLLGLYPLAPTQVTFLNSGGALWVQMYFRNGDEYIIPYDALIHIKTHFSVNDLMGGNELGQPDNEALLNTLNLNNVLLQGVKKALQSSFAINAIVKYNTMLDDGKIAAQIEKFENDLKSSVSGILGIDNKAEVINFERKIELVDDATLKFIDDKILRHFGVPIEIVRGDYTTQQYQAFYQKTLEPLIINFSEAFTKKLFTEREKQGYQNRIYFYPKELVFMSVQQTIEMVNLLGQTGTLYENEKRVAFGYEPLEELTGVRLMSLNYVDVRNAGQYQVGDNDNTGATGNGEYIHKTENDKTGNDENEGGNDE